MFGDGNVETWACGKVCVYFNFVIRNVYKFDAFLKKYVYVLNKEILCVCFLKIIHDEKYYVKMIIFNFRICSWAKKTDFLYDNKEARYPSMLAASETWYSRSIFRTKPATFGGRG